MMDVNSELECKNCDQVCKPPICICEKDGNSICYCCKSNVTLCRCGSHISEEKNKYTKSLFEKQKGNEYKPSLESKIDAESDEEFIARQVGFMTKSAAINVVECLGCNLNKEIKKEISDAAEKNDMEKARNSKCSGTDQFIYCSSMIAGAAFGGSVGPAVFGPVGVVSGIFAGGLIGPLSAHLFKVVSGEYHKKKFK